MTTEQLIVLGLFAAAFLAGWLARAVIARLERRRAAPKDDTVPQPVLDERIGRALDASREELDRAIRAYVSNLVFSLTRQGPAGAPEAVAEDVSAALRDDAANASMLSVVDGDDATSLTERELDLTDWGFTYGVAWAKARERYPTEPEAAIADEALRAAERVFRAYAADASWSEGPTDAPAAAPTGNGRARWLRPRR